MAFLGKHKQLLIIAGVMLFEAVILVLLLPSANPDLATAATSADASDEAPNPANLVEVEISPEEGFQVDNVDDPAMKVHVECKVCLAIDEATATEFDTLLEHRRFRVIEAVQTVIRRASAEELEEADLATLKRQIKAAVTDTLGRDKQLVQEVIVHEFKTYDAM